METKAPTALVASPDVSFREKAGKALERAGIQLVAHVQSYLHLPSLLGALQMDFLVLDADPPGSEAIAQLSRIHRSSPKTAILMAADVLTDKRVELALLQGASGFVSKSGDGEEYVRAIHAIRGGEIWLGREKLAHALVSLIDRMNSPGHSNETPGSSENLSPRESEIVPLIARGWTNKEIARALGMSDKTVKAHLSHIFAKLGVTRRRQLAPQPRHPEAEAAADPPFYQARKQKGFVQFSCGFAQRTDIQGDAHPSLTLQEGVHPGDGVDEHSG